MKTGSFQKIAVICIIVNTLTILAILLLKNSLPPVVPLFYGLPVSLDELTTNIGLAIPPLISICLIIINTIIARSTNDAFLEKIFMGLIVAISALSLITIVKIITLVG